MFIENLLTNTLGTILGGLLLSIIYFIIYEKIFPKKNLTGEWEAALIIKNTKYKPYEGLTVFYKIHLLHKGNELSGTGEKVKEKRDDGYFHEFEFDKRVTLSL
ncbi:hypothetical protein [Ignavibacterium sp.]|uniref:hypothetical protein n=1 Tax=Ignavibacterium sp. TaxID=2651167 RepID=UPI0021FB7307|nr:hypothetical protein [Ignavibacterium sp.]BDQ03480.1 MAG: hypothetical protein KatS3mg037_2055 [Ignavibacterium sp.]